MTKQGVYLGETCLSNTANKLYANFIIAVFASKSLWGAYSNRMLPPTAVRVFHMHIQTCKYIHVRQIQQYRL